MTQKYSEKSIAKAARKTRVDVWRHTHSVAGGRSTFFELAKRHIVAVPMRSRAIPKAFRKAAGLLKGKLKKTPVQHQRAMRREW